MILQEEFTKLIELYEAAAKGKGGSIQEVFQKSLAFIHLLKKQLAEGDEEDRKEAGRMMKDLHKYMTYHTKIMSERAGVTEEEWIADSENPSNFTPEQWSKMQESKRELAQAADELVKQLHKQKSVSKPESPVKMISKTTQESKKKKTKKSHWMKS
jgi:hypothetical protein